ncbi:MAG: alkaline phosphatase family protein [Halioglobus sp.]
MTMYFKSIAIVCFLASSAVTVAAPRLVLQITVDGLRGDLLERYEDSFGKGGFNYLQDKGVVYSNAHYLHANTETIVGHTTLATGATPAVHGMIGNVWYHADSGELGYNIEDSSAPLIPTREHSMEGAQVDPAQKRARSSGRSPRGILAPTFSDTLSKSTAGKAKIFGISGKDRSAVAMAGKTGTAYWYSTNNGDFQTSTYYMDRYPDWTEAWNAKRLAEKMAGQHWTLQNEASSYKFAHQDNRPYEIDLKGYGKIFPHAFGPVQHPLFFTRVLVSPVGDQLLLDFGKTLIKAEELGSDGVTDYLSISFSSVDAVNHFFGPSSLENEDVVIQLDRTLEELFSFIDTEVGLNNTLIVFSADHGMADMPEYAVEQGKDAGRLYSDEILAMARKISTKLYDSEAIVKDFFRPFLYLDGEVLARKALSREDVSAAIAGVISKEAGIGGAVSSHASLQGEATDIALAVRNNIHPQRSGDIYVYQEPNWFMFDRGPIGAMHGSPYSYDTHVPIIFVGPGIRPMHIHRRVHPIDVAPTMSALLNMPAPAAAQGTVLAEVVKREAIAKEDGEGLHGAR